MPTDSDIAAKAARLHAAWKAGRLGGEVMPEDAHPALPKDSDELAAYFTLGMALNYQRDSYALWRACTAAFDDPETAWVFEPKAAAAASLETLAGALLRHRVALQPNRHPAIWQGNARGLVKHAGGGVRRLFDEAGWDLGAVRDVIQIRRTDFPYLSGPKIVNYWLFVMSSYMAWPTQNLAALTVAPDRHVIAGSIQLGLVEAGASVEVVARRWADVLTGSPLLPVDLHTPLWLWSRLGFPALELAHADEELKPPFVR